MKHRLSITSVLLLVLCVACAPKDMPPELKPSYTRLEVLQRVQELQNTVIGLYDSNPRGIDKPTADLIVKFTITAADVVAESKTGWTGSLKAAWVGLNTELKAVVPKGLDTIWRLVDVMISAL